MSNIFTTVRANPIICDVVVPGYRLSLGVASQKGQTFCLQYLELVAAWCVLQGPVHAENNLQITNSYSLALVCKEGKFQSQLTTDHSEVSLLKSNLRHSLILKDGFGIFQLKVNVVKGFIGAQ